MKTLLSILIILLTSTLFAQQDSNQCQFVIYDVENLTPLPHSEVTICDSQLTPSINGLFQINCDYSDSIVISLRGYETIEQLYSNEIDTFFLFPNATTLEPIAIIGEANNKTYRLGKKNKQWDVSLGLISHGTHIQSFFPNNRHKISKIEEGFLYITENKSEEPNLLISFYKNEGGKQGDLIAKDIPLEKSDKNKGWHQLQLGDKQIYMPADGLFIEICQKWYSNIATCVGMLEINDANFNIFWIQPNSSVKTIKVNENKNFFIKFSFVVK